MAENLFLPFAAGSGANVISDAAYAADLTNTGQLATGFVAGLAVSAQVNKVARQSALMSSVLGQIIADHAGVDATDAQAVATLESNLLAALLAAIVAPETARAQAAEALRAPIASPSFTGTPTVPLAPAGDNTGLAANTDWVQGAIIAGTFLDKNLAMPGRVEWPGGGILQFGLVQSGANGFTTVTLPRPFPTQVLTTWACEENAGGSWAGSGGVGGPTVHGANGQSLTTVSFYSMQWHPTQAAWYGQPGLGLNWFALGN